MGRLEGAGKVEDPRVAADEQRAGAGGAGNAGPPGHRDRGQAVQGDGGDDDQEGDGQILDAPPTWLAASVAPKVEAVAAATMPRGAIQPVNARSPWSARS